MNNYEIVRGTKDFLPDEAALKRDFENRTVQTFLEWGYREVITPTFEYLEVIEGGAGNNLRQELFLLQDRDGRLLVLRPEMTIPIARIVSTKFRDTDEPLRLFYNANIFRHTMPQMGRYKEFYQLGVELIGAPGKRADAEVIALAAEILGQQELEFKISLNHIGIFTSLLAESGLNEQAKDSIKALVLKKDLVGMGELLSGLTMNPDFKRVLLELPVIHGGPEVLNRLEAIRKVPGVDQAIAELTKVYELLAIYGIQQDVVIDLGILRGFDYYTGIVFEGYSPQLGYPLLGGGRYDKLLDKFGCPQAATGFAVGIERVLLALQNRGAVLPQRWIVSGSDLRAVLKKARDLRAEGHIAEVDIQENSEKDVIAKLAGAKTG
ncbi:MAG: ATP phosphoribosyltransferase regulatory subunit [Syntrophomonadaceae bacterium]|nr:ATP phosphoribosyltransferase regulatory subunit [Syntrophomonadaceae bacterium]